MLHKTIRENLEKGKSKLPWASINIIPEMLGVFPSSIFHKRGCAWATAKHLTSISHVFLFFLIKNFGHATQHVGSSFPNQGLNPCPL